MGTAVALPVAPIRTTTDRQSSRIAAFVERYPQYARLPADVLLQYAETYRDDEDHTLEQELRDNGVIAGCRIDYKRPGERERGSIPFSDDVLLEAS
jgi:hypothetical protein